MDSWEERGSVCTASARRENKSLLIPISMEQEGDFSATVPLIFTALAVILATVLIKLYSAGRKQPAEEAQAEEKETVTEPLEEEGKANEDNVAEEEVGKRTERETIPVEDVGTVEELPQEKENETEAEECAAKEITPSSQSSQDEEDSKAIQSLLHQFFHQQGLQMWQEWPPDPVEDIDIESDQVLKISEADDADDEDFSFKYLPGKLRGSDYEKMLTKDELEEEQRVQREQLGAIFKMMESNRETFGKMSEGDLKEQLKLYNM
ncbi:matrix-remodeling-associated protein 7 isoform X1 [Mixophyes fleayi]|uniref:matrix-remodeling-associated protein 7 isoform X1 n=1 Tax=Mixophyes fleayi TaxID=3061075 RepID=UPI003F4E34F4